ncbi:hypothetical protein [Beijerinckia mobilis]|uniref:hypothetical protein n=1 Tax=Beijerinckia mobilis TaxID=231434 RepID=UPI000555FA1A|nr:hypothetical protein [Beijerinckia mobilis]
MAEPTAYQFSLQEVITALLKEQGISEGNWTVSIEFGFAALIAGPNPAEASPSGIVQVRNLSLVKAGPETPLHLVVSAAALEK